MFFSHYSAFLTSFCCDINSIICLNQFTWITGAKYTYVLILSFIQACLAPFTRVPGFIKLGDYFFFWIFFFGFFLYILFFKFIMTSIPFLNHFIWMLGAKCTYVLILSFIQTCLAAFTKVSGFIKRGICFFDIYFSYFFLTFIFHIFYFSVSL